jgi:hypothetical protein
MILILHRSWFQSGKASYSDRMVQCSPFDLCIDQFTMIAMQLWAFNTRHHAAFNQTAKYASLHTPMCDPKFTSKCS